MPGPGFEYDVYRNFEDVTVDDNPDFPICRTQQDIRIVGDDRRLAREIRGSHWLMAYGDYLNEMGYGVRKLGLDWLNISET